MSETSGISVSVRRATKNVLQLCTPWFCPGTIESHAHTVEGTGCADGKPGLILGIEWFVRRDRLVWYAPSSRNVEGTVTTPNVAGNVPSRELSLLKGAMECKP